ncbi:MAG: cysteine hydrolase [Geminicoccaceae bacterium]
MSVPLAAYVYGEKRPLPDGFEDFFDPGRTAIISIDMHQGHLADTPDCPCPAPRAREIVAPIDSFHEQVRRVGVPIIHVRSVLRKGGVDDLRGGQGAWRRVFPLHVGPIPNSAAHAIEGSRWTEFVTHVEPDDLLVETKKRLTPFYPTDLDFLLRNLETRTVVLNGVMTDCCVLNAAFDASNRDYRVIVLRDLVRGTNEDMEDAALKMLSLHLGLVMDADDLLGVWQQQRQTGIRQKETAL